MPRLPGGRVEAGGVWALSRCWGRLQLQVHGGGSPEPTVSIRGPGGPSPGLRLRGSRATMGQAVPSAQRLRTELQERSLDWNRASMKRGHSGIPREQSPSPHGAALHSDPSGPCGRGRPPPQTLMMPSDVLWPSGSEVKLSSPLPKECSRQNVSRAPQAQSTPLHQPHLQAPEALEVSLLRAHIPRLLWGLRKGANRRHGLPPSSPSC